MPKLIKTPIVDKNGKQTHVYKNVVDSKVEGRGLASKGSPPPAISEDYDLANEIEQEIERVRSLEDEARTRLAEIVKEHRDLLDMQFELRKDSITLDSDIEDLRYLSKTGFSNQSASQKESELIKELHPSFSTDSYSTFHQLPYIDINDVREYPSEEVASAIERATRIFADGRDELEFGLRFGSFENKLFVSCDSPNMGRISHNTMHYAHDQYYPLPELVDKIKTFFSNESNGLSAREDDDHFDSYDY